MALNYQAAVNIVANYKGGPEVKKAQADFRALGTTTKGISSQLSGFGSALRGLVGALAVREVVQYTKSIIDMADNLRDLSQKTGFGVQALSDLKAAAEDSGLGFDGLQGSLTKFTRALGDARNQGGADAFSKLGIDLKRYGDDANEVFLQVADRLSKYKDGPAKAAAANAIFGKSWSALIPLINGGRDAIEGAGVVITDDFADRADAFNDSINSIKRGFSSLTVGALGELLPVFQDIIGAFQSLPSVGKDSIGFFDVIGEGARFLAVGLNVVYTAITAVGDAFITRFKQAKSLLSGESSTVRDQLEKDFTERNKKRASNAIAFGNKVSQNSLLFGDGTPDKIKGRQQQKNNTPPELDKETVSKLSQEIDTVRKLSEERKALADTYELERNQLNISNVEYQKQKITIEETAKAAKALVSFKNSEQRAAYQAEVQDLIELKKAQIDFAESQRQSFGAGAKQAFKDYAEAASDTAGQTKALFNTAFQGLEDALVSFVKTGKLSFADLANSISEMLLRIAIQRAVASSIAAAGFADGGIMTSSGPVALKSYARGGVANSPQLALFGEGSMPEAYVPLPDGRSIPVSMKGGSQGGGGNSVVVNVNIVNGRESGESSESDSARGRELGQVISMAVKTELVSQMRPGGMLARR